MTPGTGFLTRLARSKRAATLPLMAAAVIPLIGMLGGGLDLSRLYIVKTRLQHACDAGALAGRRTMGGGTWTQSSNLPARTATQFFDANIENRAFGATVSRPTYTESAGRVTGTATADVPMTLMRVFGYQQMTLTATCDAEMRLPNTDVMFVLDVTGSMGSPISGDSEDKIVGLRRAVRCFYEILARLDTEATCDGGAPSGGTGADTQIRFGFVPYSTNVNVGRLLDTAWVANEWTYQSRSRISVWGVLTGSSTDGSRGNWSSWGSNITNYGPATEQACRDSILPAVVQSARSATFGAGKNESNGGLAGNGNFEADQGWRDTEREFVSYRASDKRCRHRERTRNFNRTYQFRRVPEGTASAVQFNAYRYAPTSYDISDLKNGDSWNFSLTLPTGNSYADATVTWDGCIEERQTVRAASYWPIPANAFDLEVDLIPDGSEPETQWGPALPGAVFAGRTSYSDSAFSRTPLDTFTQYSSSRSYACPGQARRLQEWPDASAFDDYVDTLQPTSSTYHDIGLLWGARLISPTGLFAADNRTTPEGGEIERHVIFMTDGDACTDSNNYQAYGYAWFDRRTTSDSTAIPTGQSCSSDASPSDLTRQIDARTSAICEAVKNRNITLWVIWFGASQPALETHLRNCASASRFFSARNSAQLQQTFRDIANQISQLRLTS